jgi:E3 ubiquitin-protein ligase HERC1
MYQRILPWRVDLLGEGSFDAGGPAREIFTEIMLEALSPTMRLFVPSPNSQRGDKLIYIPDRLPLKPGSKREKMYKYFGVLMSVCLISRAPVPLRLSSLVWNCVTDTPTTSTDIALFDSEFTARMDAIRRWDPDVVSELKFEISDSCGNTVPLIGRGSHAPVTFERRLEFAALAEDFTLGEFSRHLNAIKAGFWSFLRPSPSYFLPEEVELLVAGQPACPIEEMKKHIVVPDNSLGKMLWRVLESFTTDERMMFIKFGCGRMSLPAPGLTWSSHLKVHFAALPSTPGGDQLLPMAGTCSWTIIIPAYPTEEMMAARLRVAITWGGEIDTDRAPDLRAMDEGA